MEDPSVRPYAFAALVWCLGTTAVSAQKPRDLSKLDPCKTLTTADLEAATKGKVTMSVGGGLGATACTWVIDSPSAAVAGEYHLLFAKADITQAAWDVSTPAEKGTPVPGIWDEAYMVPPGSLRGNRYFLTALKKGDMAIEVQGASKDVVTSLGKTAVSRLK